MNKEDTFKAGNSGSPDHVILDHQKFKDAIWELYSKDLKAAQDQDIILSSGSSRRSSTQSSQSQGDTTGKEQRKGTIQDRYKTAENNFLNQKSVLTTETETISTKKMEKNTNRRPISPHLNEILDFVVRMESKDGEEKMEVSQSVSGIQSVKVEKKEEINNSTIDSGKVSNLRKQEDKNETNKRVDVNQNMNINQNYMQGLQPSDEEKDKIRHSKRLRLPGIDQVINKTSFAHQIPEYYSRIAASGGDDTPNVSETTSQQFSKQRLKQQIRQVISPSVSTPAQEEVSYSYPNALPERPAISRLPATPESFNPSNERPMTASQGCHNSPLLSPSVPKSDSWSVPNVTQGTSSLISPPEHFQNNVRLQREAPGMVESGNTPDGQTSPSVNSLPTSLIDNQNLKYKTNPARDCYLPSRDSTISPQMENIFPPNAMVTRSDPSCPFQLSNRQTLLTDSDYLKNLYHKSSSASVASPVTSPQLNQAFLHSLNVNAQKPGLSSITQSPIYSPNQVLPSYNTGGLMGVKMSPTTPPANTNTLSEEFPQQQNYFTGRQNLQYSTAGASTRARPDINLHSSGQVATNPGGINLQALNYGHKNPEPVSQGCTMKNKSQWSGPYGNASALYQNLQGFPTPISSPRVQEFPYPNPQNFPSLRGRNLPSARQQRFTPPRTQQFPSPHSQEFPHSFNQQYSSQDLPSTSIQEYPSPYGQYPAPRPDVHSLRYPQRNSASVSSAPGMDLQMLNQSPTTKNYPQLTTTKTPRKRRVTKAMSVAQTKRIQKKRKEVEEKLLDFMRSEQCDQKTSLIITKHLYHIRSCPNWLVAEECPICNQICEMVAHTDECQNLNCPFLYCGINALTVIAENFSNPKFVYGFLKQLNITEEEMKDVYVLKNWKDKLTPD